ncbi:DUF6768 family protein [Brevundimonas sp.]|uniref:DUF6768 family protein n=1 Tax=Brevundimonas sp. TaxID=1871086 RepID=UPI002FD8DAC5
MQDLDRMIEEALNDEDRALFERTAREPGYFDQLGGLFGGTAGWVNAMMVAAQTAIFIVGVWTAWRFFQAEDVLTALHWGLPSAVLLLMSLMIKLALWPALQANRVIRELKRIELQIARSRG